MPAPVSRPGRVVRLAALVALALVFVAYFWTAYSSAREPSPASIRLPDGDYYNGLTDAFLAGRTHVDVGQEPAGASSDLSLYRGRYYLYWGPTPVITFFLPGRLLGSADERSAVVLYAFVGFLLSLALLRHVLRRLAPDTPGWVLWFAGLGLATSNVALFLLRRPTVYEVAIAAAYCFLMAFAYLLATGVLTDRVRWGRVAGASLCLGLAVGARPTAGLAGVLILIAFAHLMRRPAEKGRRRWLRPGLALFGPVALCGVLLAVYNRVRFDSWTEFGQRLQLNEYPDPFTDPLGGFIPGLYWNLLAPPRPSLNFPFLHIPPPPDGPVASVPGYALEGSIGVLAAAPIALLAFVGLPVAVRATTPALRRLGHLGLAALAVGALIVAVLSLTLFGASMRYGMDFAALFVLAGLAGWAVLLCVTTGARHRITAVVGALLIAFGAGTGAAIGLTGPFDLLRQGHPRTYDALEDLSSPIATAGAALVGRPVLTEVRNAIALTSRTSYVQAGLGPASFEVGTGGAIVEILSPGRTTTLLRARLSRGSETLPGPAPALAIRLPDEATARPVEGLTVEIPVRLRPGRNELTLAAVPIGTAEDELRQPLVAVDELRLVGPSPSVRSSSRRSPSP